MGQRISALAHENSNTFQLTTLLEHKNHPEAQGDIHGISITTDNASIKGADVLIEFTLPDGTIENLHACVEHNVKMVIGTTGFNESQVKKIHAASEKISIVFASNMSVGVNVLFKVTELVAKKLQEIDNITVYEEHHIHKKDKPSGTAKTLGKIAQHASGYDIRFREPKREGDIVGNHDVTFETGEDILTLSHHAKSRDMFARGALQAVIFLMDKDKGLYDMQDVLGLDKITV